MKSPNQALYDLLFSELTGLAEVYSVNPPEGTKYPFIQLGSTQTVPRPNKTNFMASIFQTVDVWGKASDRRSVSDLAEKILFLASQIRKSPEGYKFILEIEGCDTEMMVDNSTNDDLWRARITLKFSLV